MVVSLVPFVNAGKLLEKVSFVVDIHRDDSTYSMITCAIDKRLKCFETRLQPEISPGRIPYGGRTR